MKKIILLIAFLSGSLKFVYCQSCNLDSSFGINGIVKSDLGSDYSYELIGKKVLLHPDGSIYIILLSAGETIITKKHSDGSLDLSYGRNGFSVLMPVSPVFAAFQNDGKIVVAGTPSTGNNAFSSLVRYNADGSADNTFSGDGIQDINLTVTSIVIQTDGKIVAAGSISNNGNSYFAVARYNSDASADFGFSNDGVQTTDFGFSKSGGQFPESDLVYSVVIQGDGKIVVAGTAFNYVNDTREFAVARYNTNGNPDSTFSSDGKLTTNFGFDDDAYSAAIQTDGKIVVAGYTNPNGLYSLAVARYKTNGILDTSFNGNGKQITQIGSEYNYPNSVALQADGKIVVGGVSWNGNDNDFTIVRYNTNGKLDLTFDGDGKLTTDFGSTDDYANSLAIQSDGKIIAEGYAYTYSNNTKSGYVVARYNTNGSPDNTFNGNGKIREELKQGYTVYSSTAIQKDGKIIAAGYTWNGSNYSFATMRYNISGSIDSTFSGDGVVLADFGANDGFANSTAIQNDGKIVVAGVQWNGSNNDFAMVRYNPDGSPDSTFGSGGKLTTDINSNDDFINSVIIQADGKIVVAGYTNTGTETNVDFVIARYNVNGSPDNTFSGNGNQITDFNLSNDFGYSAAIQTDGKIVVAGYSNTGTENNADFALARYNTDGSLDNTFNGIGKQTTDFGFSDDFASSAAIQKDGKIVAGGHYGNYGAYKFALARYNIDGRPDSTFSDDGKLFTGFEFSNASVNSIAMQNNGKIVAGGSANDNFALVLFNGDGNRDTTFGKNGILVISASDGENRIQGIAVKDNKIYAAGFGLFPGNFGVTARYLINLSPTAPAVNITSPTNNTSYTAPATIKITADASDPDGTIYSVKFYKNTVYLKTSFSKPYTFNISNLPPGTYSFTAKATDNTGLQTTSAPVTVTVNGAAPVVTITSPANNAGFTAPASIKITAAASAPNGKITSVKFYRNTNYLKTLFTSPYTYTLSNLPAGTYSLTAKATDNTGAQTTSAAVNIVVTSQSFKIVSNKNFSAAKSADINEAASLKVGPDPARNVLNVYLNNNQKNKVLMISVISAAGNVVAPPHSGTFNQIEQVDVSSLVSGIYIIKVICGTTVIYKRFVKL